MTVNTNIATLWKNYPAPDEFTHDQLFEELGWNDIKSNKAYENTCAIRMSLCLIRSGINIHGRLQIKKGIHKGKWIEPGQVRLSKILATINMFGPPVIFKPDDRYKELSNKKGIVSFMRIPGYQIDGALSGHIDLVRHGKFLYFFDVLQCIEQCYWNANEVWFWPLR